jgi:thioredoxin-related protein
MRLLIAFMVVALTSGNISAQQWEVNFAKAKELASKDDKPIVLVFQGSDWCAPCIKLDKEIWSTKTFVDYAEEHYILLQADFPRRKANALSEEQSKANAELAEKYNKQGYFPFVVVLDSNGKVLGNSGYKKTTPENYIKELNAFVK